MADSDEDRALEESEEGRDMEEQDSEDSEEEDSEDEADSDFYEEDPGVQVQRDMQDQEPQEDTLSDAPSDTPSNLPSDLEYVDEALPILRIHDLVGVDEMAERDPSFLGVTDSDVMNYAFDFFPTPDKARGIAKSWRDVIETSKNNQKALLSQFQLVCDMERTPADAPQDEVDAHMRILAIQDVQQRLKELERASLPYAPSGNASENARANAQQANLKDLQPPRELETLTRSTIKLIGIDARHHGNLKVPLIGFRLSKEPEPITQITQNIPWRTQLATAERERRKRVLATIPEMESIDDLHAYLHKNGISLSTLTAREFKRLSSDWRQRPQAQRPRARPRPRASTPTPLPTLPNVPTLLAALDIAAEKLRPTDDKLEAVLSKIQRRLDGMDPPIAGFSSMLPMPLNPQSLADAVDLDAGDSDEAGSLNALVEAYRDIVKNQEKADARAALETAYQALEHSDQWKSTLAAVRARFDITLHSMQHVATIDPSDSAFPAFSDEKQAKAGDDISGYTGAITGIDMSATAIANALTHQEQQQAQAELAEQEHQEQQERQEHQGHDAPQGPQRPSQLPTCPTAQREVFSIVLPELRDIATRTRLPVDLDGLVSLILPHTDIPSRLSLLQERIPGMPDEQLAILLEPPHGAETQAEEWLDTPLMKRALIEVNNIFIQNAIDVLSKALATWTVELQETFADRRLLDYAPPPSMTAAASMWGFHGPPMTRTRGRGTLMYLLAAMAPRSPVFADFLSPSAEQRVALIGDLADSMYPERTMALREQFDALKPVLQAQKEALKAQQQELKKFLEGNGTVDRFVAGLLQLPKIMAMSNDTLIARVYRKSSHAPAACCAQSLGNDFRAYADFHAHRPLRGLLSQMKALAKESQAKREAGQAAIGMYLVMAHHPTKDVTAVPTQESPNTCLVLQKPVLTLLQLQEPSKEPNQAPNQAPNQGTTAPAANAGLALFQEALGRFLPPVAASNIQVYVEERMQAVARASRTPKAYAAWMDGLNSAQLPALAKLALQLAALSPPSQQPRPSPAALALYALRGVALQEREEQRVLDMARLIIAGIAQKAGTGAAPLLQSFAAALATPDMLNNKISELRERQKAAVLNKLNSKDPEMRKLLTQMNRLGVVNISTKDAPDMPVDTPEAPDAEEAARTNVGPPDALVGADEAAQAAGEGDFLWQGEDHDNAMDALD